MPTRKLTDLFVERVKPPASGRIEYFDASFPGLALRITENGGKSWCAFYRFHGRLRRFTIGSYPAIKPAAARKAAQAALERVRLGVDPAEEKRARRDQRPPEAETFEAVARDYLNQHHKRTAENRRSRKQRATLKRTPLPAWGKRPIASITRRDVIELIDRIVQRGAEVQANRTLARLRAFFNWAIAKDSRGCLAGRPEIADAGAVARPRAERRRTALAVAGLRRNRLAVWAVWQACSC